MLQPAEKVNEFIAHSGAAILREGERLRMRKFALSSTTNFAKVTGYNPWNFKTDQPRHDPETGFYPWCPYAEKLAKYMDDKVAGIAKPVKPGFVARNHIKTTIVEQHIARRALLKPNRNFLIVCDNDVKAEQRLARIASCYKKPEIQELFRDELYPNDGKARYFYTGSNIYMKRLNSSDATIAALGIGSSFAGWHATDEGAIWMDDLVNEKNYRNPEIMETLWQNIQQIIQYVASPGCEIIITGTRYTFFDSYKYILDEDSPIAKSIVPGAITMGCTDTDDLSPEAKPLFFLRFCLNPEDADKPVVYKGVTFDPVRESLIEKRDSTHPKSEFYAQMMNKPVSSENQVFSEKAFDHWLPCNGTELREWLQKDEAIYTLLKLKPDEEIPKTEAQYRSPLYVGMLGDIAYADKSHSDYSVWMAVAFDNFGHLYILDGERTRYGLKGLKDYLRKIFSKYIVYGADRLGVEVHAKESTLLLAQEAAIEVGAPFTMASKDGNPGWNPLKDNSYQKKTQRIATALESLLAARKLHICKNVPRELIEALAQEAIQFPAGRRDDTIDTLSNARQIFPVPRGKTNHNVKCAPMANVGRRSRRIRRELRW